MSRWYRIVETHNIAVYAVLLFVLYAQHPVDSIWIWNAENNGGGGRVGILSNEELYKNLYCLPYFKNVVKSRSVTWQGFLRNLSTRDRDTLRSVCNSKFPYRVYISPPLVPTLKHVNSFCIPLSYFFEFYFNPLLLYGTRFTLRRFSPLVFRLTVYMYVVGSKRFRPWYTKAASSGKCCEGYIVPSMVRLMCQLKSVLK